MIDMVILGGLLALAVAAVWASLDILFKGPLYHRIKPASRPRRWVLIVLLVMFAAFIVWIPIWAIWPHTLISKVSTILFGVAFCGGLLVLRNFSWLVDLIYKRKGWPLR
jgi:quinol-cytochrome oxidoreductase complex cytochrome b subunit